MFRGTRRAALTAVLVPLLLTGCSAPAPAPAMTSAPSPSATATPAFASKEEAFAAAEKVYRRYLKAEGALSQAPGKADLELLTGVVTTDMLRRESQTQAQAAKAGLHLSGGVRLVLFRGQQTNLTSGSTVAYTCVDLSRARVLNENGEDVTPRDRATTATAVSHFSVVKGQLLLDRDDDYSGKALC